jgi:DNA polymerase-3 subunit beta
MKLTINKENFVRELAKLQGIGEKRQTMLILSNVLITADNNKISLLSTNMEVGMLASLECDVIEKVKQRYPQRVFMIFVKKCQQVY